VPSWRRAALELAKDVETLASWLATIDGALQAAHERERKPVSIVRRLDFFPENCSSECGLKANTKHSPDCTFAPWLELDEFFGKDHQSP
jgi:hypothetical protein